MLYRRASENVVVLAIAMFDRISPEELWIAFGTGSNFHYRISSNSFRGIYSFQVLPAAATKRGRLLNEGGYY